MKIKLFLALSILSTSIFAGNGKYTYTKYLSAYTNSAHQMSLQKLLKSSGNKVSPMSFKLKINTTIYPEIDQEDGKYYGAISKKCYIRTWDEINPHHGLEINKTLLLEPSDITIESGYDLLKTLRFDSAHSREFIMNWNPFVRFHVQDPDGVIQNISCYFGEIRDELSDSIKLGSTFWDSFEGTTVTNVEEGQKEDIIDSPYTIRTHNGVKFNSQLYWSEQTQRDLANILGENATLLIRYRITNE